MDTGLNGHYRASAHIRFTMSSLCLDQEGAQLQSGLAVAFF